MDLEETDEADTSPSSVEKDNEIESQSDLEEQELEDAVDDGN